MYHIHTYIYTYIQVSYVNGTTKEEASYTCIHIYMHACIQVSYTHMHTHRYDTHTYINTYIHTGIVRQRHHRGGGARAALSFAG